jgi:hypothetical protein
MGFFPGIDLRPAVPILILEEAARGKGYRGLSDFLRSVSLQSPH